MSAQEQSQVLMTLPEASKHAGKPEQYFRLRRFRYRYHPDHPFPQPKARYAGVDVFDVHSLLMWDEQRVQRDQERVEQQQARRERIETARAAQQEAKGKA